MWRLAIALSALPALAFSADSVAERALDYYCTDSQGQRRELGEVICVTASCLTWMARCEMSLNNPMWRKLQDGCPAAGLHGRFGLSGAAHDARDVVADGPL